MKGCVDGPLATERLLDRGRWGSGASDDRAELDANDKRRGGRWGDEEMEKVARSQTSWILGKLRRSSEQEANQKSTPRKVLEADGAKLCKPSGLIQGGQVFTLGFHRV